MGEFEKYKPKYIQLVERIKRDILNNDLKTGDRLLSENELKKLYNVSSTTVRKCIDILKHEGLINRVQGIGTFVNKLHIKRSLEKILSFTKNMEQVGLKPSSKVLEKKVIFAREHYCEKLKLNPGEKILRLKRLRFGSDIPMMLETRYISIKNCPTIVEKDLAGSLYDIYETFYGIILTKAQQNLKIVFLNERDAKLLGCEPGAPAFLVTGVTYSTNEEPIEYEESLYRGDEYEFFVEVGH
ncbi:MAG: GntR family transcriptional regulator [Spirochaetota bacterium]